MGCVTYWDESSFPIIVSPDATFDTTEIAYVSLAVSAWNNAAGEQVFELRPNSMQSSCYAGEGITLTHNSLGKPLIGLCPVVYYPPTESAESGRIFRGHCYVDVADHTANKILLAKVVVHELGHALGFVHDEDDPASYMFPTVGDRNIRFTKKHIEVLRKMVHGTYPEHSPARGEYCL